MTKGKEMELDIHTNLEGCMAPNHPSKLCCDEANMLKEFILPMINANKLCANHTSFLSQLGLFLEEIMVSSEIKEYKLIAN